MFNCTCHYCLGQHWLVNGILSLLNQNFDTSQEYLPNGISYYELAMPALLEFNESTVQCVVFNGSNPHIFSSTVQLLVQGLLSEVSHPSVTQINSTVLSLQYTAPYTLTGVPILHYNILILPTNASVNITDTQYNIHINDHCINYNIIITPWNIVGAGNITTLSNIILYQAPVVTMPQLIEEYNNGTLQVYIEFQYNISCKGTVPQSVSLTINKDKEYHCSVVSPTTNNCTVTTEDTVYVSVTMNITNALEYGAIYSISMSVNNTETTDFTFNISTYHVITAALLSTNDTTVCLECQFKQNSPSTGCYAVFHPINTTGEVFPIYYRIMKSLHDTIVSDCISTLPNGVYSISILDALSYEEGMFNNTAINIPSLITIQKMTTTLLVSSMSVSPATTVSFQSFVDGDTSSSFFFSPPFSTNYNYPVTTSVTSPARSGPSVLTITLSGAAVIVILIIIIITVVIVGLCITERKKKNKKAGDTALYHTASAINPMIKEYNATLNEAYDTIGGVTHPNMAYETIKATGRGTTAGGIQANVAYESIRANSVQVAPTEPTERMYDTINK
ncbi:PREDICTED: uncharacterized protein LOC109586109 [Amphimedon queenslandica]|uniref:Fibronectin type-III domain-containing protein n=2 Tax=Amphimedon queenslandica TaxID=400682 RepID=A0AAN0JM57_AMPQE|nr:PREDICTED: uncharacterized protein LOC109586109 [Amphimedon queenslandica]|eukprot:XP_019857841.1 PREDICTED: uncharacterized protein LOC109586109 [Amphimedon queenslandica]